MKQATQISRPMQIALVATLVLFAVWFGFIKPKTASDDVAAAPVTPVVTQATVASTPGKTNSALDKTAYAEVQVAKDAAATASTDAAKTSGQTGEGGTADAAAADAAKSTKSTATASTPAITAATTPIAAAAAGTAAAMPGTAAATASKSAAPAATTPAVPRAERLANKVILKIQKDLAARKAVVVLVWSKTGAEDKILHTRISKQIDLRHGKVKTFFIPVSQVGRYDGLLSGLNLGQTPSTIVIAPNNQAQVLGGLTSTARIDRLTSAAVLIKPAGTTPGSTTP